MGGGQGNQNIQNVKNVDVHILHEMLDLETYIY